MDLQYTVKVDAVRSKMLPDGFLNVGAAVGCQPIRAGEHPGLGEGLVLQPQLGNALLNQPQGVVIIENGIIPAVAQQGGMAAQHAVGRMVEGPAPETTDIPANQMSGPLQHFPRRTVGEGQ